VGKDLKDEVKVIKCWECRKGCGSRHLCGGLSEVRMMSSWKKGFISAIRNFF
jgi:hypothetical protein